MTDESVQPRSSEYRDSSMPTDEVARTIDRLLENAATATPTSAVAGVLGMWRRDEKAYTDADLAALIVRVYEGAKR